MGRKGVLALRDADAESSPPVSLPVSRVRCRSRMLRRRVDVRQGMLCWIRLCERAA